MHTTAFIGFALPKTDARKVARAAREQPHKTGQLLADKMDPKQCTVVSKEMGKMYKIA